MNNDKNIQFSGTAPVAGTYDVVVCGGGPAGFIAAIAAAREGAKVAVVEQYGFFGGMATAGFVNPISVFSYNGKLVNGGIPWEFVNRLAKIDGCEIESPLANVAFEPEHYKLEAQRLVLEAGVDMYMHSYLTGCIREGNRITHVLINNKNGTEALAARIFIDCTGDADLAHMSGVPMQESEGRPLQPMSSYFILSGVDLSTPMMQDAIHHNKQGVNCHCLPVRELLISKMEELHMPEFGGPWFCSTKQPGTVTVNITRTAGDACDNRDFTAAECRLREDAFRRHTQGQCRGIQKQLSDSRFSSGRRERDTQNQGRTYPHRRRIPECRAFRGQHLERRASDRHTRVERREAEHHVPQDTGLHTVLLIDRTGLPEPHSRRTMHQRRQDRLRIHTGPVQLYGDGTGRRSRCRAVRQDRQAGG